METDSDPVHFCHFQKKLKMTKVDCEDCYEKFTSKKLYINQDKISNSQRVVYRRLLLQYVGFAQRSIRWSSSRRVCQGPALSGVSSSV